MLTIREYKKVQSLEEAWELNQKRANRVIGGMMWMRLGDSNFQTAIDLSGLGLDTIEETEDEFRIGCMVTLRQLETHPGFVSYTQNMCKESLRHIVGVQFRNLATVGGSIYGRYGFSDVLTLLIGLDSYVELYKGGIVPLREFAKGKPHFTNSAIHHFCSYYFLHIIFQTLVSSLQTVQAVHPCGDNIFHSCPALQSVPFLHLLMQNQRYPYCP